MAIKVIQWSTGNVGGFALRAIVNHPELELAGLWVHSEKKAGREPQSERKRRQTIRWARKKP